jgi:hypothetical protein
MESFKAYQAFERISVISFKVLQAFWNAPFQKVK